MLRLLKVRSVLANTFSQRKQLLNGNDEQYLCPIVGIKQLSNDTYIYKCGLQHSTQKLGIPVGNHLILHEQIEGNTILRKYTPISKIDQEGTFDLLIKIYRKSSQYPNGGLMTQEIDRMKVGDNFQISGPIGRLRYLGNGNVIKKVGQDFITKNYKGIVMCAAGSGITPIYQIIQYVVGCEQSLSIYLLYNNKTESDILLKKELDDFQDQYPNLHVTYAVDDAVDKNQQYLGGQLNADMMDTLFKQITVDDILACTCGPQGFNQLAIDLFIQKGMSLQDIFKF